MGGVPYPADLYDGCPCLRCQQPKWTKGASGFTFARMTLCPTCGSKRCPGAVDHDKTCTRPTTTDTSPSDGAREDAR